MWPARRSPTGTSEQALASLGRAIWSWEMPAESQLAVEPSHRVFDIGSLSDYTLFMHGQ